MKRLLCFLTALLVFFGAATMGHASAFDSQAQLDGYLEDGPVGELWDTIPPPARELLGEGSLWDAVRNFSPSALLKLILDKAKAAAVAPLRMLVSLVGIILICAILSSFNSTLTPSSLEPIFYIIISVFVTGIIIDPVVDSILQAVAVIQDFAYFILTFIPVFAGVVTAAGQPMTGAAYNLLLFGICQIVSQVITRFLVPVLCAYLALSIVSVVCPRMNLTRIVSGVKTFVTWSLNLILTSFVGLLTIQSVVASAGDSLTIKTTKFLMGSLIPVVGGALSDIFVAAQGYISLVKSTVGVLGILVTLFTFLPILIQVVVWYLTVKLGCVIGDLFQVKEVTGLLGAVSSTLGILIAVLLYYALLVIISTTLLIVAFKGG